MARSRSLLAALLLAAACRGEATRARATATLWPSTTDGAIAMSNLDVQIASQRRLVERRPSVEALAALAALLQGRAQFAGTPADWVDAAGVAERAVALAPSDPRALLARAAAAEALHRFPEARADLAAAARGGGGEREIATLRASLDEAEGHLEEALAARRVLATRWPSLTNLGRLGALEAKGGDRAGAERHFDAALATYRDTSPLPVAWLELQRGLALDAAGRLEEAARWYRSAVARLPAYPEPAAHLAAVSALRGRLDEAERLLRPHAIPEKHPQLTAQLAEILDRMHRAREAATSREAARRSYEALLQGQPEAYAEAAARFYLPTDPRRALALARENLALRKTWEAFEVALWSAEAAGSDDERCRIAEAVTARPRPPEGLALAASRASEQCRRGASGIGSATPASVVGP